jgi:hypothetical protein
MSTDLSLHTQDLADAIVELDRIGTPNSQMLHGLAEHGSVRPLNEKQLKPLRKQGQVYQGNEWASPILTGQLPLDSPPNAKQIKSILMNEIGGKDSFHFVPTRGSPETDARAIVALLNNIENVSYSTSGAVLNMVSPTFERLFQFKVDWPEDGMLGSSHVVVAVTPADDVQDMEYYDTYTLSTLLHGSKVWLAYPPLLENFAALQEHYKLLATDEHALGMNIAQNFHDGILIVQQAGQGLIMPPFWTATAISTQMSVAVTYQATTASAFVGRIKHLSDFRLTCQLGLSNKTQEQNRLAFLASELVDHLQRIFEDSFPHCKISKVITDVCREYETLRAGLRQVLQTIDDKAIARGLENQYRAVWTNFLEEKRKKNPACRLCNTRVQDMPAGISATDRLHQHFVDFHCLRSERFVQPVARQRTARPNTRT